MKCTTALFLLATAATLLASWPTAAPGQGANVVPPGWQEFLESEQVFGDFDAVSLDAGRLDAARHLIYATAADVASPGRARLAARALSVGIQLEHQAMLMTPESTGGPGVPGRIRRRDHAWRVFVLSDRLNELLARRSIDELEPTARARALWEKTLLGLQALREEARQELPSAPRKSLREEVCDALVAEFFPDTPYVKGSSSPNALLMNPLRTQFEVCRQVANTAAAASVQASLALGSVYGYPPVEQRRQAETRLAAGEIAGSPGYPGLFPPGESETWILVIKTVMRTYGGGLVSGIVGNYAEAREALVGTSSKVDVLSRVPVPDAPDAPLQYVYDVPETVYGPYDLARLVAAADDVAARIAARAPEMTPGASDKAPGATRGGTDRPEKSEGLKFGPFTIDKQGITDDGRIAAYMKWYLAQPSKTSRATVAAEKVEAALKRLGTEPPPVRPLGEAEQYLTTVAATVLGLNDAKALDKVRTFAETWLNSEIAARSPRFQKLVENLPR
jgi:hypothetical protein